MRITVFGGSAPKPGSTAYQQAFRLGQLLGENGHTALTGGYIGTMEAVSRGCAEAGGHVIGITCEQIEAWRPVKPNHWVMEEMRYTNLNQRLLALIEECEAAIALPGGVGTLTEISMMWNQMQTHVTPLRPLVLVGSGWEHTFKTMFQWQEDYVPAEHRSYISFADDIETAFQLIHST